jgi:hypothetical protein
VSEARQGYCSAADYQPIVANLARQLAIRFDKSAFLHDALMFLERTFNPVDVIAVSIRHPSHDLIPSGSRVTLKQVWN